MRGEPTASPDFQWEDKFHGYTEPFWDNDVDSVLHHQYFMLNEQYIDRDRVLNFSVPIYEYRLLWHCQSVICAVYSAHLKEIAGNAIVIRRDFGRNLGLQVVELMDWKLLEKGSSIRQHSGEIRCFMLETA
ncbi:U5 small nuclear ribonucleoprotein helicase [Populus alba x Populus x berolinensis]|uniref:U5 small nuclear ribonucleoprotein helicase n=2 Tax=Populus TaxID=3689 RepID=A0A4U5Q0Z0_POPAL|nr:U5 small nuclear ribonucleoprotein helicase [Populus alba x Populus x berolinensis]TKS03102.1 U5 small nuclear ribonucleoprotein helicase [Populus alba]